MQIQNAIRMLKYQKIPTEHAVAATCDRCGREMHKDDRDGEWYERVSFSRRAGFDSIFGDGNDVEIDLCQRCFQETLGQWIRITDPLFKDAEQLAWAREWRQENPSAETDLDVLEEAYWENKRKQRDG